MYGTLISNAVLIIFVFIFTELANSAYSFFKLKPVYKTQLILFCLTHLQLKSIITLKNQKGLVSKFVLN